VRGTSKYITQAEGSQLQTHFASVLCQLHEHS